MKFHISIKSLAIMTLMGGVFLLSCRKETPFGEDYDLNWPLPIITSVSPATAMIESEIRLTGTNLDRVIEIEVGSTNRIIKNEDIVSKSSTEVVFRAPRLTETGKISVKTNLAKKSTSTDVFTPIYPEAVVESWPSVIYRGQMFQVKGQNMDMLTSATFANTSMKLEGGAATQEAISVSTEGIELGEEVVIVLEGRNGVIDGVSPSIPVEDYNPTLCFEAVAPIVIYDFEDGIDPYVSANDGTITDVSGINTAGIGKGREKNYLTVTAEVASGSNWNSMGSIAAPSEINLADFTDPHLTFLINTNGKRGYFQVEITQDGNESGGHFVAAVSDEGDDYTFPITEGWEWRSVRLADLNGSNGGWGDAIDPTGVIELNLGFKQGNGGNSSTEFELNIDQIMITDGKYDPRSVAFTFEDGGNPYAGSLTSTINGAGVDNMLGSNYLTVSTVDNVNKWDWTGAIENNTSVDLSTMDCPYVNIWVNTGAGKGYFQVETNQGSTKYGISQTAPDYFFETNGQWQLVSIALIPENMSIWGGSDEFDPEGVLDYIKIGFSTGNIENEPYSLSVDDVIVSEGPLF